jgi:glycine cleavage system protein P-like pyridoxal-binding family
MLTNPNTLGVFEQHIHKIADILHAKGGLLYMDGANMNALVGKVRPGDFRRRCDASEFSQNIFHPARRWWARIGSSCD